MISNPQNMLFLPALLQVGCSARFSTAEQSAMLTLLVNCSSNKFFEILIQYNWNDKSNITATEAHPMSQNTFRIIGPNIPSFNFTVFDLTAV